MSCTKTIHFITPLKLKIIKDAQNIHSLKKESNFLSNKLTTVHIASK